MSESEEGVHEVRGVSGVPSNSLFLRLFAGVRSILSWRYFSSHRSTSSVRSAGVSLGSMWRSAVLCRVA